MSENGMLLLLRHIAQKRGLSALRQRGLLLSQISKLLASAEFEGLVAYSEADRLLVTPKGHAYLNSKKAGPSGGWIEPARNQKIEPLDSLCVYVPNRKSIKQLS